MGIAMRRMRASDFYVPVCFGLASLLDMARGGGGESIGPNMWSNRGTNGAVLEFIGDPSPGLAQRMCYHYYGHTPNRNGKEWDVVNCSWPFDFTCVALSGEAEMEVYQFKTSYVRGCHFRCPCPESQPWQEW